MGRNLVTNLFLKATKENYTRAATIGNDVEGSLHDKFNGGPDEGIYTDFKLANDAYQLIFGTLASATGQKEGATLSLTQMIADVRQRGKLWWRQVTDIYAEGSAEYKILLPDGITPFSTGKQTNMLQYLNGFSQSLADYPGLAATKSQVDDALHQFTNINLAQKGKIGARNDVSGQVEASRIVLCTALLVVQGHLTIQYAATPEVIDDFFPMELLRRSPQKIFTGSLAAGAQHDIAKRTLSTEDNIIIKNTGAVPLIIRMAATAGAPVDGAAYYIRVAPGSTQTVAAPMLGDVVTDRCLIVYNESDAAGSWEVEM